MTNMNDLRRRIRGPVHLPTDSAFEQARRPWNLAIEQPVAAVVEALDADDVASAVAYAGAAGLAVSTQPSGHGASGDVDGVILLRTERLNALEIRPAERATRVGAGVQWGRVLADAGPHGLLGLAGSSPVVSVVGYTLGGGLSWFGRKYGFAADSVTAFDVVGSDGTRSRVTADSDTELFWALRGGGGDFAVVTAMEFDLHPAPHLYGGRMLWPAEQTAEVMAAYLEVTASAPEELTTWLDLLQFPGAAPLVAVDATYLGTAEEGHALLSPLDAIDGLISDSRAPMAIADLGAITAEPTAPGPGLSRSGMLTSLSGLAAKTLISRPVEPMLSVQIRHLGGALARPSASAAGHLDDPFCYYLFGLPTSPERTAAVRTAQQETADALAPVTGPRKPFTYLAPGESVDAAFPAETLARLRGIKRRRDPKSVLRSNFPVLAGPGRG